MNLSLRFIYMIKLSFDNNIKYLLLKKLLNIKAVKSKQSNPHGFKTETA